MMSLYCPHSETCPFYRGFVEKAKHKIINPISPEIMNAGKGSHYNCMALDSFHNGKSGIPAGDELRNGSVDDSEERFVECSHLTLLNLLGNSKK